MVSSVRDDDMPIVLGGALVGFGASPAMSAEFTGSSASPSPTARLALGVLGRSGAQGVRV